MRKLIALLLLLTLLVPGAIAEAPAADETPAAALPWDLTPGYVPNPDNYVTDESGARIAYQDETVTVTMERVVVGDSTFNVARIRIAHASQLRTGLANEKGTRTNKISTMAANHNAIVAIGGDYFSNAKNGYVVRMGTTFRKSPKPVYDMLLIDDQGNFHIILKSDPEELQALLATEGLTFPNAFHFGPAMIKDGVLLETPQYYIDNGNKYNIRNTHEPRCAIGQLGPLEYMFVVVDGRRNDSDGCSVAELGQWMFEQGCTQAYNLDGGNSALLWFGGANYSDKTVKGERSVSDIIYISTGINPEAEEN